MKTVLIVILNHNKKDMVIECLRSVKALNYPGYQVVVVDNASTDGSQAVIRLNFPDIELVLSEKNTGAPAGRNMGVRFAPNPQYDYIWFLDDDAEVRPDTLSELVAVMDKDKKAGIACSKTYTNFKSNIIMSTGVLTQLSVGYCFDRGAREEDKGQYDKPVYVDACGGFGFFIRRALFEKLNGFDEIFSPYGWEDIDICLRAERLGFHTRYVPTSVMCHKGTRIGRKPIKEYEMHKVRNYLILLDRHMTLVQKLCGLVCVPLRGLWLFITFIFQGHASVIPGQIKGFFDFVGGKMKRKKKEENRAVD